MSYARIYGQSSNSDRSISFHSSSKNKSIFPNQDGMKIFLKTSSSHLLPYFLPQINDEFLPSLNSNHFER
jgi:hypothetical protein